MSETQLLAYLLDHAFETGEFHSLLGNLRSVDASLWHAQLPGSVRCIAEMALHVGSAKIMYTNHAFAGGRLTWQSPEVEPWTVAEATPELVIPWLEAVHGGLMAYVRGLGDDELTAPRRANWGELKETRWLLSTLLQHDAYHAGEINRMRSLLVDEDRWRWQIDSGITR